MYLQADNDGKIIINKCRLADGSANLSETTWRGECPSMGHNGLILGKCLPRTWGGRLRNIKTIARLSGFQWDLI
jgi:hypothetical protein